MENVTPKNSPPKCEAYTNTFGTFSDDNFTIHTVENRVINLDNNLRRVKLIKKRNYRRNIIFFGIAMVAALLFYKSVNYQTTHIVFGLIALLAGSATLLIVEYRFTFMVIRRYDYSEFDTDKKHSEDAELLASMVNNKIQLLDKISGFRVLEKNTTKPTALKQVFKLDL